MKFYSSGLGFREPSNSLVLHHKEVCVHVDAPMVIDHGIADLMPHGLGICIYRAASCTTISAELMTASSYSGYEGSLMGMYIATELTVLYFWLFSAM